MYGILAVVAHPDDETFGCGGTLASHAARGASVRVLCLTCNPADRRAEIVGACAALGVPEPIVWGDAKVDSSRDAAGRVADVIVSEKPSTVITHLPYDYHAEHRAAYGLVKEAVEWAAHTTAHTEPWLARRLLLMEVNTLIPSPGVFVDISDETARKRAAVASYGSQLAKFPWRYYEDWAEKKAELRGVQARCSHAEAFQEEALPRNGPFYPEKSTRTVI